ncbi:mucin-22-like [Penaeus vannamei]|uniref:mucin-22-like n=1 Tax=Penaeus vannamei TaxID=6689 RepID=UPI00387F4381
MLSNYKWYIASTYLHAIRLAELYEQENSNTYTNTPSTATEYTNMPNIATECTNTPIITSEYTNTPSIATEYTNTPSIATEYANIPSIATKYTNAPSIATEYTNIPNIATEYTNTPNIATEYTNIPSIANEYTNIPSIATEYTNIATEYTNTPSITSEYTNTPSIGTEYTNTSNIATEYTNIPSIATESTNIPIIATESINIPSIATEYTNTTSVATNYANIATENTNTLSTASEHTNIANEYIDESSMSTEYTNTPSMSVEYTNTPNIATDYTNVPSSATVNIDMPSTSKMSSDPPNTTIVYIDIFTEFTNITGIFSTSAYTDEDSEHTGFTTEYDNTPYDTTVLSSDMTTHITTETPNSISQTNIVTENFYVVTEQARISAEVPWTFAESTAMISDRGMAPEEENSSVIEEYEGLGENSGTTTEDFPVLSTDSDISTGSAEMITVHPHDFDLDKEISGMTLGFGTTTETYDVTGSYGIEGEIPDVITQNDDMAAVIYDLTIDYKDETTEDPELPAEGSSDAAGNPIANIVTTTTDILTDTTGTSTEKTINDIVKGTGTSKDSAIITSAEPTISINTNRITLTPSSIEMTTENVSSISETTIYTSEPIVAFHHPSESNIYVDEGAQTPSDAMAHSSGPFAEVTPHRGQAIESSKWEGVRGETGSQDPLGQEEGAFGQEEQEEPSFHAILTPQPSTERMNPDLFSNLFFPGNPQDSEAPAMGTIVDLFDIRNPLRPVIRPPFPDFFGIDGPLLRPDLQLVSCDDGNIECVHWARGGGCACAPGRARRQCEWQMYVQETCPRSCGLCP